MSSITEFARVSEGFISLKASSLIKFVTQVLKRTKDVKKWQPYAEIHNLIQQRLDVYVESEKNFREAEKMGEKIEIAYQNTVVSNARNTLLWAFLNYAHAIQFTADGDKAVIESTGFETKKTGERNIVTKLDNIENATIEYGSMGSGAILVNCDAVIHAKWYEIEISYDDGKTFQLLATVTTAKSIHTNFEGSVRAIIRVRAGGPRGLTSDWYTFSEIVLPLPATTIKKKLN